MWHTDDFLGIPLGGAGLFNSPINSVFKLPYIATA